MARIIIDEHLGMDSTILRLFQDLVANEDGVYLFIEKEHPGIPDVEILDKLLQAGDVLLTCDIVLHARARDAGFQAYTIDEQQQLTQEPLQSLGALKPLPQSVYQELLDDYRRPVHEHFSRMNGSLSEKQQKGYRTARRRINSYFGANAAIAQSSVTIGARSHGDVTLTGFSIRLAGNSGVKGQRGREGYYEFRGTTDQTAAVPLLLAVRELYLLRLDQVATNLFVIPPETFQLAEQRQTEYECPIREATRQLLLGLANVTITACTKGRFHDETNKKLASLSEKGSNEIQSVDYAQIARDVLCKTE
jgi:hypothetical protein